MEFTFHVLILLLTCESWPSIALSFETACLYFCGRALSSYHFNVRGLTVACSWTLAFDVSTLLLPDDVPNKTSSSSCKLALALSANDIKIKHSEFRDTFNRSCNCVYQNKVDYKIWDYKKKTFLTTQYCRCLLQLSKSFYFQGICLYAIWFMIESGVSACMYSINKHYMHNSVYACSDLLNCFYMDIYSSFKRICLLLSNQKRINI